MSASKKTVRGETPVEPSLSDIQTLSYEQAFAELEEIVAGLETNQKTLEEVMNLFERGQSLSRYCAGLLEQAELRVRQLGQPQESDDSHLD